MRKFLLILVMVLPFAAASAQRLSQIAMIDLPGRPGFEQMTFAGNLLVIAHPAANTVDVFDPAKRRLVAQITNIPQPNGIVADSRNNRVFVAGNTGNIYVISTEDWQVKDTFSVPGSPERLELSGDGRILFVADQVSPLVLAVDLPLRKVAATGDTAGRVGGIAAGDGNTVFVTLEDQSAVLHYDDQMKPIARYKVAGSQPTGVAYSPEQKRLYVAARGTVIALDANTGAEIARATAPKGVDSLWLDEGSNMLFAAGGGAVVSMDTAGGHLTARDQLPSEVKGQVLAYDSGRKLLYLPGGREGHSKLLIVKHDSSLPPAPQPAASEASLHK